MLCVWSGEWKRGGGGGGGLQVRTNNSGDAKVDIAPEGLAHEAVVDRREEGGDNQDGDASVVQTPHEFADML